FASQFRPSTAGSSLDTFSRHCEGPSQEHALGFLRASKLATVGALRQSCLAAILDWGARGEHRARESMARDTSPRRRRGRFLAGLPLPLSNGPTKLCLNLRARRVEHKRRLGCTRRRHAARFPPPTPSAPPKFDSS